MGLAVGYPRQSAVSGGFVDLPRGVVETVAARVATPLEWLLNATTDVLLKLIPLRGGPAPVTDEEIGFMLREGVAAGHIPQAETAIVEMALRLGDRRVSAVMTPRT